MDGVYSYTGISQRGHSNADSILNIYEKSTKYQISKFVMLL